MFGPHTIFPLEDMNKAAANGDCPASAEWNKVVEAQKVFELSALREVAAFVKERVPEATELYLAHEYGDYDDPSALWIDPECVNNDGKLLEDFDKKFYRVMEAFWWIGGDGVLIHYCEDGSVVADYRGEEVTLS